MDELYIIDGVQKLAKIFWQELDGVTRSTEVQFPAGVNTLFFSGLTLTGVALDSVYFSNYLGDEVFSNPVLIPISSDITYRTDDINGDGYLDCITYNKTSGEFILYLFDFPDKSYVPLTQNIGADYTLPFFRADIDRDGFLDIHAYNSTTQISKVIFTGSLNLEIVTVPTNNTMSRSFCGQISRWTSPTD